MICRIPVEADRIRPKLTGLMRWMNGSSFPTRTVGAVETMRLQQPTEYTPSVSPFGLTAFSRGMIATGNHNFERFAALCNTP